MGWRFALVSDGTYVASRSSNALFVKPHDAALVARVAFYVGLA
jgi:hypothetical protein